MYLSQKKKIYYNYLNKNSPLPTLVFLHGMGANHTTWNSIISHFKKLNYPLLYQDLRGHGNSQILDSYKLEDFVQDLKEILIKEKINKQIILIGHSMGGMISLIFYNLYPKKIKKLILIDTSYKNPIKTSKFKFLSPLEKIFKKIISLIPFPKEKSKILHYDKLKKESNYNLAVKGAFKNTKVQLECIKNMIDYNALPFLKKIKAPTLIIGSTKDELFPTRIPEKIHKCIKGSKLKIIEGGHLIITKKPGLISKTIQNFIR